MTTLFRFEIPATDIERAVAFYGTMLDVELPVSKMLDTAVAHLPGGHGALVQSPDHRPNAGGTGVMIYLHCEPDLAEALARVEPVGGVILVEKTPIGPNGYVAHILDSEGNKIGLHSTR